MNGIQQRLVRVAEGPHARRGVPSNGRSIQSRVDIVEEDESDASSENEDADDGWKEAAVVSESEGSEDAEEAEDEGRGDKRHDEGAVPQLSGWADSMAKILGSTKPKNKKNLMLSRAKKDYEVLKVKEKPIPVGKGKGVIEVVPAAPNTAKKPRLDTQTAATSLKVLHRLELELKRKEKEWENINRVKPDPVSEKAEERELVKVATKGVVQLFNAVSLQQKTVKSKLREARRSEFKKDKVLHKTKEIFDSAMEKSKTLGKRRERHSSDEDEEDSDNGISSTTKGSKEVGSKKPTWQALHDDYMLDAKMKDWDRSSSDSDSDEN